MMNEYNEKTAIRTRRMPFRPDTNGVPEQSVHVLPIGTHLGEFEIVDLIGEGGFGIVYLAYDHSLDRHVALKEYMPSGLATRTTNMVVNVRSQHNMGTFSAGLKSFINEAKMLAQFDSPSLVKVHRFWEGNGTAYMVMPFYEGITLKRALREHRITPTEAWIRLLLADLFDAIETIHRAHCLHRDIAPDNILLLSDHRPLLLDFGAARRVISDLTQCLTVILKPGYAPIEQYADIAGLRQGPWTDIYALAAVVYFLITGNAPPPAVARMMRDEMVPACEAGKGRYSNAFLAVLDKALAVKPEQRYRSISELRRALNIMETVPRTLPDSTSRDDTTIMRTMPAADATLRMEPIAKTQAQSAPQPPPQPPQQDKQRITQQEPDKHPVQRSPERSKREWLVAALLFSAGAGIATGVYLGTTSFSDGLSGQAAVESGNSNAAPDTSGSSEAADESEAQQAIATAPTPPAPPVASTRSAQPAAAAASQPATDIVASTSPRTDDTTSPKPDHGKSAPPAPPPRLSPEDELWRAANISDKASAYERYLREYPKGRYAAIARMRLEAKQPKTATTAPPSDTTPSSSRDTKPKAASEAAAPDAVPKSTAPSAEEELWSLAKAINEAPAYEAYLNKYPNGRYAAVAKDKLAGIKPAEPAKPAPPPVTAAPQMPETPPAEERKAPEGEQLASIKPPEEAVPKQPAPEPQTGTGKKSITVNDQTFTGDFSVDPVTGLISGTGKIVWTNGNQFEGTLVRGIKEGKGKFTWSNGQRYSGDWAKDKPNGKGTVVFANGGRYEGEVKDGVPHGQGSHRFKSGDLYSGSWASGKSDGHGRYTWPDGSYWEGEFKDDKRTENGKMVFAGSAKSAPESTPPSAMKDGQNP